MIVGFRRSDWWSPPTTRLGLETRRAVTLRIATARRVLRPNLAAPGTRSFPSNTLEVVREPHPTKLYWLSTASQARHAPRRPSSLTLAPLHQPPRTP